MGWGEVCGDDDEEEEKAGATVGKVDGKYSLITAFRKVSMSML